MGATAAVRREPVICPVCAPHSAHAPGECDDCKCKAESRPGRSEFVIRDALRKGNYFQRMTGIGPMFGGTLAQAKRFSTGREIADTTLGWPMTAIYKVESVPLAETPKPAPFLKWAGGKRQLVAELLKEVPADRQGDNVDYLPARRWGKHYYEPFVGGGALFFALRAWGWTSAATLGDANARLIATYSGLKQDVEMVIEILRKHKYDKKEYLRERARKIDIYGDPEIAAWMIYLNRTGYNGLYRVNRQNVFNVPFGRYTNPTICDAEGLRLASKALARTKLVAGDFEKVVKNAEAGDLVYFDPPYVPVSKTADFTSYTAEKFGPKDQERLRDCVLRLKKLGTNVILSSPDVPTIRKLYAGKEFKIRSVTARRNINSKGAKRGAVGEVIIT